MKWRRLNSLKARPVILDIIPYVVVIDALMAIVANFDILTVKGNPARVRKKKKRRYSRSSCFSEKKKVQGCVSQNSDPMNSILRKVEELGLNASAGHQKFLGCTWYETKIRERKGQSGGVIQKGEPHERNHCAPSSEEEPPQETSRQAGCTS